MKSLMSHFTDYQRGEDVSINRDKSISEFYNSRTPNQFHCYDLYETLHN